MWDWDSDTERETPGEVFDFPLWESDWFKLAVFQVATCAVWVLGSLVHGPATWPNVVLLFACVFGPAAGLLMVVATHRRVRRLKLDWSSIERGSTLYAAFDQSRRSMRAAAAIPNWMALMALLATTVARGSLHHR